MRTLGLAFAAGALLIATQANAGSFPINSGLTRTDGGLVGHVAVRVYVHEGHRYCSPSTAGMARAGTAAVSPFVAESAGAEFLWLE